MKQKLILFLWLSMPLLCMAQSSLAFVYEYDASGNRVRRKVINLSPPQLAPPTPQDSLQVTSDELQVTSDELLKLGMEYFVEKIAQVEIKIYPNPTTENITFEISGWEDLKMGKLKLFNLSGQMLQEQMILTSKTNVSLSGFSKGAYIMKVQINDTTEEWKIIKQ